MSELGKEIRAIRESLGLGLMDFGMRMGVSMDTQRKLEMGDYWPSERYIAELAEMCTGSDEARARVQARLAALLGKEQNDADAC